ncbi:MAG: nucleotidyltransferase domain-containing protein [Eubacteriales bacterium]|nr:nucleotidyltransferase domain-containing protein [Bacillota bacterium]MBV1726576.1 nucleotidyltransferase domain-containing protein [Desulforudis sp.]MDQ7788698.1 nucleotidyltransferase domain-containing protein [Clostridia bacterium]MDZ4043261.1 nucleotidyltransferase domain-containing protein [Eubacteriales bacterium]MBU4532062.1 nucleotidyltransferase domain-containing protein [Bacillota bacterium]
MREKQALKNRYERAMTQARVAADHLKKKYGCRVFLFGSIVNEQRFMDHSDIDMAVAGVGTEVNFWVLYSEVMKILHPFEFYLVELERIEADVCDHVLQKGLEL